MNWKELQYNHRGYLHHPSTPREDVSFYFEQKDKTQNFLQMGINFVRKDGAALQRSEEHNKEELGINSKNLHRGVYCPSPVLDLLFSSSKRGKVLTRANSRSHVTNRYRYDQSGRLTYIDNYYDGTLVSSEYLVYQENCIYGITIGLSGKLLCVSEEIFENKQLISYTIAYFSGELDHLECYRACCEQYRYHPDGLLDWDYYRIEFGWEKFAPSGFIDHKRYRFEREKGIIVRFFEFLPDGTVDMSRSVDTSGKKRSAEYAGQGPVLCPGVGQGTVLCPKEQ